MFMFMNAYAMFSACLCPYWFICCVCTYSC